MKKNLRPGGAWAWAAAAAFSTLGCTYYTDCPSSGCPDENTSGGRGGSGTSGNGSDGGDSGSGGSSSGGSISGPPVEGSWSESTGNLAGEPAGSANVCYVTVTPRDGVLITGISERGLWSSEDGGLEWVALGTSSEPDVEINNRTSVIVFDPEDNNVFWEAGSYGTGVFRTTDGGESFTQLGVIDHSEGLGVDFTDPDRATLYASAHERGRLLYRSIDGGDDWQEFEGPVEAGENECGFPLVFDADSLLVACRQTRMGAGGIYLSDDAGDSWEQVAETPAWETALEASDGTLYWAADYSMGLLRSTDRGVTWSTVNGSMQTVHPLELPNGHIASVNANEVVVSDDRGETWRRVTPELPYAPNGIAYSHSQRAFYAWHYTGETELPADAIVSFAFDYEVD